MYVTVKATKYREQNVSKTSKTWRPFELTVPYTLSGTATMPATCLNLLNPTASSRSLRSSCEPRKASSFVAYLSLISCVFLARSSLPIVQFDITPFSSFICSSITLFNSFSRFSRSFVGPSAPSAEPNKRVANPRLRS